MTDFTGERVIPGQVNSDLWAEHISRYNFAARYVNATHRVLDIGCGTGYGTAELSFRAASAAGLDISLEATEYAAQHFQRPNLSFHHGSATELPFPEQSFDVITAFEVIEHVENWQALITQARRVLHPSGIFIVSTPNVDYYTESRGAEGPNPFHVHEFAYQEFHEALSTNFPATQIFLQNRAEAFAFYPHHTFFPVDAHIEGSRGEAEHAHYFVAICSPTELPPLKSFVYVSLATNLLREREHHIHALDQQLTECRAELRTLLAEHDRQNAHLAEQNRWAIGMEKDLEIARGHLNNRQSEIEDKVRWARTLEADLSTARSILDERNKWAEQEILWRNEQISKLTSELEDRTRWALSLNERIKTLEQSRWLRLGQKIGLGPL